MHYNIFIPIFVFSLFTSCSTKKNKFLHRSYHNVVANFNTLHNGQEAYNTAFLEATEEDIDFTKLLEIEKKDSAEIKPRKTLPASLSFGGASKTSNENIMSKSSGFARGEEKAFKAIENHSMEIGGRERNKRIDDAYMLLGKSRFHQNKPFEALDAFNYIITYHKEHDQVNNAKIWAAKALKLGGNTYTAYDRLMKMLKNKQDFKNKELVHIYEQLAIIDIERKQYGKAIKSLENANTYEKIKQKKYRNLYLIGQLYRRKGALLESSRAFAKLINKKPPLDYFVFSTIEIAKNYEPKKHDLKQFDAELKKLSKTKKYYFYRAEILNQLGEVYLKSNQLKQAETFLTKALQSQSKYQQTRSIIHANLAEIAFQKEEFEKAKHHYDSVTNLPKDIKNILGTRMQALEDFVKYLNLKKENDSILTLASLPLSKKKQIIKQHIKKTQSRRYKKKKRGRKKYTQAKKNITR